jgi:NADPH:quinone reductase-like Zn-dependent oxidoreductase
MRSLGAEHVIDYNQKDFTSDGEQYDLILDLIAHHSVFAYQRALRPGGTYFCVGGSVAVVLQILLLGPWIRKTRGKNIRMLVVPQNRKDLISITGLCEAGKVVPAIDKRYLLSEAPEAFRYLGEGRAKGKVVITLESGNGS